MKMLLLLKCYSPQAVDVILIKEVNRSNISFGWERGYLSFTKTDFSLNLLLRLNILCSRPFRLKSQQLESYEKMVNDYFL